MNHAAFEDFARWHQQNLLDEAARGRLVATMHDTGASVPRAAAARPRGAGRSGGR